MGVGQCAGGGEVGGTAGLNPGLLGENNKMGVGLRASLGDNCGNGTLNYGPLGEKNKWELDRGSVWVIIVVMGH